jgi:hypothetical protein
VLATALAVVARVAQQAKPSSMQRLAAAPIDHFAADLNP